MMYRQRRRPELCFLDAVEDQQLGPSGQLQDGVLAVEAEPLDRPVQRPQHEYPQGDDLDVGPDFSGSTRVEKEPVPVFCVGFAKGTMRFLESFGQLTVDPDIRGCEVA